MTSSSSKQLYVDLTEVLEMLTANEELLVFHLHRLRMEFQALGEPGPAMTPRYQSPRSTLSLRRTLVVANSVDAAPSMATPQTPPSYAYPPSGARAYMVAPQHEVVPPPPERTVYEAQPPAVPPYSEAVAPPSEWPTAADSVPADGPSARRNYDYFAELDKTLADLARKNQDYN